MNVAINQILLDDLTELAKNSDRLRMSFDLRNSPEDKSQRILNAIEPGSIVPIHRHQKSSETVVIIRGSARELLFDENGREVDEVYDMKPGGECVAINIPRGRWHTLISLESGTVVMESKDGPYEPLSLIDTLH